MGGAGEGREIGETDSSDDDNVIGPPLPPGYSTKRRISASDKGDEKEGEGDESEEDEEEDDSVCI